MNPSTIDITVEAQFHTTNGERRWRLAVSTVDADESGQPRLEQMAGSLRSMANAFEDGYRPTDIPMLQRPTRPPAPDLDTVVATSWDHSVGVNTFQTPVGDSLLLVTVATPGHPKVIALSGETPPLLDSDRDRALLRAFCTLALQRLDEMENT